MWTKYIPDKELEGYAKVNRIDYIVEAIDFLEKRIKTNELIKNIKHLENDKEAKIIFSNLLRLLELTIHKWKYDPLANKIIIHAKQLQPLLKKVLDEIKYNKNILTTKQQSENTDHKLKEIITELDELKKIYKKKYI